MIIYYFFSHKSDNQMIRDESKCVDCVLGRLARGAFKDRVVRVVLRHA